jgi:acetyl-CoA synthetase
VHTTGGYLTHVKATTKWGPRPQGRRRVLVHGGRGLGHRPFYLLYGPLANGGTTLMFEGTPSYPENDRWWDIIERHKVSILYTAPTAIRAFMKGGTEAAGEARPSSPAAARERRASRSTHARG